ncbi:ERCC4 domain-containing protein [Bacteroides acidifaciens]|uniref:ERCC4 domain-containing protein n=1 Tax=Bacteroides acidifaciens TaxID=85831 RepID=UPI0030147882
MQVQVDTREHAKEWERIKGQFDALGVQYFRSKMYVGDYQSLDNPRLVIDRKKDLQEICGNVSSKQHERFKAELLRAKEQGIKLVILCEHGADIKNLEDVYFWQNPRKYQIRWKTVNGKRVKDVISAKAVDGNQLYKSLCTIRDRYNVDFVFCQKEETGQKIIEILGGQIDE